MTRLFLAFVIGSTLLAEAQPPQRIRPYIPFVGCESNGQQGPQNAPHGKNLVLPISTEMTRQLAYYEAENGIGVLAPRGWRCFGAYGSGGTSLFVSPEQIPDLFSITGSGFPGPAIEIATIYGDTSGRFMVARAIARVFPARKAYVESVIRGGEEPASEFPFGPYPKDKLTYRSNAMVEYQTPANSDGLGTDYSQLKKNGDPISGVAILVGREPNLVVTSIRLPSELTALTPAIIQQAERDARTAKNR
jgi:hypothetical protein